METTSETSMEFIYSFSLGCLFSLLAVFALQRTLSPFCENTMNANGAINTPGKVIITFYFLILLSALLRAVWFFLPVVSLQGSYSTPLVSAYSSTDTYWTGYVLCQFIQSSGSISVYSVFMLISSYWQDTVRLNSISPVISSLIRIIIHNKYFL
jgi:hypothetical protein